jgi:cytochrome c-type biogenesis protein CcmH
MIAFWSVCAVMMVIALAYILPPLLQREEKASTGEINEANLAVYRDQLRELEADLHNGIVSKEQYEQDRDELERRLLEDVSPGEVRATSRAKASRSSRNLAYSLAVGMSMIAILLYLRLGNQNARSAAQETSAPEPASASAPAASNSGEMTKQQIEANVAALAKRLEQNPNDAQGWAMLARSYSEMQNYKEASAAYEKATAMNSNDATLWADYAYALAMARGRDMQGKPVELVNRALQIDPQNPKALALAGNAAFEAKNYHQAIDYWQKLLKVTPPNSEVAQTLTDRINEARRLARDGASK